MLQPLCTEDKLSVDGWFVEEVILQVTELSVHRQLYINKSLKIVEVTTWTIQGQRPKH